MRLSFLIISILIISIYITSHAPDTRVQVAENSREKIIELRNATDLTGEYDESSESESGIGSGRALELECVGVSTTYSHSFSSNHLSFSFTMHRDGVFQSE